ncbi:hypothetical protein Pres01_35550 [Metapseudomonas resinovorans]|uniref:hypothetical protein n=1 Tax=Metapseudomonas resinovorans TaxID=53412 RepID=UPI000984F328|nr:hypothetical protein [Pseudomonas resinovorans]GLZ87504.1 hypothetical protein Pres01_35550 [Pseudomonas resinovorans]
MKTQAIAALFIATLSSSVFALPSSSQTVEPVIAEGYMVLDRVAEGGSDRTGANRIAEGGSDRTGANRIAEGGSDRLPQAQRVS